MLGTVVSGAWETKSCRVRRAPLAIVPGVVVSVTPHNQNQTLQPSHRGGHVHTSPVVPAWLDLFCLLYRCLSQPHPTERTSAVDQQVGLGRSKIIDGDRAAESLRQVERRLAHAPCEVSSGAEDIARTERRQKPAAEHIGSEGCFHRTPRGRHVGEVGSKRSRNEDVHEGYRQFQFSAGLTVSRIFPGLRLVFVPLGR